MPGQRVATVTKPTSACMSIPGITNAEMVECLCLTLQGNFNALNKPIGRSNRVLTCDFVVANIQAFQHWRVTQHIVQLGIVQGFDCVYGEMCQG